MDSERIFSLHNRWSVAAAGGMLAILVVSALIGFVWLPSAQRDPQFQGIWNAICSAAGVPRQWFTQSSGVSVPGETRSTVTVTPQLLRAADSEAAARGGALVWRCSGCHNASLAVAPDLAAQDAAFLYKQLLDFKSGARTNVIMTTIAASLTEREARDIAMFFGSRKASAPRRYGVEHAAPPIVAHGAPVRNVVACATCHGGVGHKAAAPLLQGMSESYLHTQLTAFANGERHNDIDAQMRNIVRNMTDAEISAAARFFASAGAQPEATGK
ncbi:c-type cytochrome [Paraburkholderia rhizosphaerae]|uniref:Cytochrome c553 n=1 Tax=Paraburkholderia rhizosphaerae TaxID=480658 RepID=A0A4R8KNZ5_9BURK|nr:c-type cytochrome [Paraburkholderia rhizosphaerae]TDY31243.1 cytochrome c553 [Paraburkholderia rhizosphaerae]